MIKYEREEPNACVATEETSVDKANFYNYCFYFYFFNRQFMLIMFDLTLCSASLPFFIHSSSYVADFFSSSCV